jgi:Phage integrase family
MSAVSTGRTQYRIQINRPSDVLASTLGERPRWPVPRALRHWEVSAVSMTAGPIASASGVARSLSRDHFDGRGIRSTPHVERRQLVGEDRQSVTTPFFLVNIWRAAGRLKEPVWRDLARFLIAVPCRRGEAAQLDWSHLDLGAAEWRQPAKLTKNRDPHRLHLHPLVLGVLGARKQATDGKGLVFPAPRSGDIVDTFSDIKTTLTEATSSGGSPALTGWTWHDFRRSFATALGEAGIPEAVADAILNHRQSATRGGVLGVYQRASRWPEQVKAMQLWGWLLAAAIEGREVDANVVLMTAHTG